MRICRVQWMQSTEYVAFGYRDFRVQETGGDQSGCEADASYVRNSR